MPILRLDDPLIAPQNTGRDTKMQNVNGNLHVRCLALGPIRQIHHSLLFIGYVDFYFYHFPAVGLSLPVALRLYAYLHVYNIHFSICISTIT